MIERLKSRIARFREALVRISPEAQQVRREGLTYLGKMKIAAIERELRRMVRRHVPGDVVEFGVALGGSGVLLARAALADGRRFRGYDVFAMIPAPTSDKDDDKSKQRYETIRTGAATGIGGAAYYGYLDNLHDRVTRTFGRHGVPVDGDRVALIKGLFDQTWPVHPVATVAFAHIDCDWYDPVRFCLEAIADRVSPDGVIVLDDYFDYGGCRTATDEFLEHRPDYRRIEGRNLILRRQAG
jgi:asparagine synthase (glutamine-hydrolysing)